MSGFTTRTFQDAQAPDPEAITAAAEQVDLIRRAALKTGHHLDASPTRHLHKEALELKERADRLSIRLTEFAGE